MMFLKINKSKEHKDKYTNIESVVNKKVCCGCGACAVVCSKSAIDIIFGKRFNYAKVKRDRCVKCGRCLEVCPSSFLLFGNDTGFVDDVAKASYDCYLIYSRDDNIRIDASSGGFITGIILHLMNKKLADGAIVAKCEGDNPLVADSYIAFNRQGVLSARASKYTPVSSCAVLFEVIKRPGRYIFVGTPCMIEALTKAQELLPNLQERIILKIGLVCSGMPSRQSTRTYLERYGINLKDIGRIAYRGGGWPGKFRAYGDKGIFLDRPYLGDELSYLVARDHYLRCWNCLDHWGRFADIAVSDPWCDEMIRSERKGRSAVMVRTARGKQAVGSAIDSTDVIAEPINIGDMLGYNMHLVIDSEHPRHAWMAVYQLLFFGRFKNLLCILKSLVRRKDVGVITTLKARLNWDYYECGKDVFDVKRL